MKKLLVVGIVVLFIMISIVPSSGDIILFDDTMPPFTMCTLNPPEPDEENGWYVNDVTITLEATDDMSGVNTTYYRVNGGEWETYIEPFVLSEDGMHSIEYYSVDNAGNVEDVKSVELKIDQTKPKIKLRWDAYLKDGKWYIMFTCDATDTMSGMNRVEFYKDAILKETVTGPGPIYKWITPWNRSHVRGIICFPKITEDYVKFYAIIIKITETNLPYLRGDINAVAYDNAGNSDYKEIRFRPPDPVIINPDIYLFKYMILPNDYEGHIGRFFINAMFCDWYEWSFS